MEIENTCQNCKYYVKHYQIYKGVRLRYTGSGHCACEKTTCYASRKRIEKNIPCQYWEQVASSTVTTENVQNVIKEIKLKLDEIALILKTD